MPVDRYHVFWAETAYRDLEAVVDYIASDSIDAAIEVYKRIREKALTLDRLPSRGRVVPELRFHNITSYRELVVSPWRIIYRIEKHSVYVLAVFDGRRNIEDLLLARLIKE
jgi:plasmid stabilization system protein ParE